jgi:hypothetical protein
MLLGFPAALDLLGPWTTCGLRSDGYLRKARISRNACSTIVLVETLVLGSQVIHLHEPPEARELLKLAAARILRQTVAIVRQSVRP